MALTALDIILAAIIGTLGAIVYSLRVMIRLERKLQNIDGNISRMARKILVQESKIARKLSRKKKKK